MSSAPNRAWAIAAFVGERIFRKNTRDFPALYAAFFSEEEGDEGCVAAEAESESDGKGRKDAATAGGKEDRLAVFSLFELVMAAQDRRTERSESALHGGRAFNAFSRKSLVDSSFQDFDRTNRNRAGSFTEGVKDDNVVGLQDWRDISTSKKDISVVQLLHEAFPSRAKVELLPFFALINGRQGSAEISRDLTKALRSGWAFTSIKDSDSPRPEASKPPAFIAFGDVSSEGLSVSYFVAQGRPSMAFHLMTSQRALLSACQNRLDLGQALSAPLQLSPSEAQVLQRTVLRVCLHNLLDEGVAASAICFLDFCGLEGERLRVDFQSARRIYLHRKEMLAGRGGGLSCRAPRAKEPTAAGAGGGHALDVAAAEVISLFLEFPQTSAATEEAAAVESREEAGSFGVTSQSLLKALRWLEEATWALSPEVQTSSAASVGMESPWRLVALFCRWGFSPARDGRAWLSV